MEPPRQSWIDRNRSHLMEIGTGLIIYATFRWLFENVLYVYIIYRFGLFVGGAIMTFLSVGICSGTLFLYQHMRIDWVGAGILARFSSVPNPSWWQRIISWGMSRGSSVIFLVLSIFQDPFITTSYFRQGRFGALQVRDWKIFFGSVLVGNLYWTLRSGIVVAILESAWRWLVRW